MRFQLLQCIVNCNMTAVQVRNYLLYQELGRGAFGVTYLGYDTAMGREVAIKTVDIAKSSELGINIDAINGEINTLKEISGSACSKYIACYYESFQDNL